MKRYLHSEVSRERGNTGEGPKCNPGMCALAEIPESYCNWSALEKKTVMEPVVTAIHFDLKVMRSPRNLPATITVLGPLLRLGENTLLDHLL